MAKVRETIQIIAAVVVALLINVGGKYVADGLSLPMWLDSIGTCMIACLYGPACGAIVGAGVNVSYGFFEPVSFAYALSSIGIGVAMGRMARKKVLDTFMGAMTASVVLTVISTVVSVPINMLFYNGDIQNVWGNGVYEMLLEADFNKWISAVMGEFCVDFADKTVTVLLLFFANKLHRKIAADKKRKIRNTAFLLVFSVALAIPGMTPLAAQMKYIQSGYYTTVVYDSSNGLPEGEANDIAFTKEGYLWVGTYGGLYQYDGTEFRLRNDFKTVRNVNCPNADEEGRLWIGTNDGGMSIAINGTIANTITVEDGLSSDSVRAIGMDIYGNVFVGTSKNLDILNLSGGLSIAATIPEVQYAYTISSSGDGYTVVVSNSGEAHVIRDRSYLYKITAPAEGELFNCGCFDARGELLLGTYSDKIYRYRVGETESEYLDEIATGGLKVIQTMTQDDDGNIWICSDTGIGYIDGNQTFQEFNSGTFRNSVEHFCVDYQGNLWFSSSRQGLLKVSKAVFSNLYARTEYKPDVVNAITRWNDCFYIGTDSGLDIMDAGHCLIENDALAERLKNQRVRCLYVSSDQHLWVCTTTGEALLEVYPTGEIREYSSEDGMLTDRHRSCIELYDGTIAVAEDGGIDFIRDGKVVASISEQDGLASPRVLTLYEDEKHTLYAGTDGGGIAVINNRRLDSVLTVKDGLTSEVILRIVGDRDGMFLITSNGISFMNAEGAIRNIENFPYFNNFDLYIDSSDYVWVLSGVGVYVVSRESMLADGELKYVLLNAVSGLSGTITANAWRYVSEDGIMYIACDDGCYMVDTSNYLMGKAMYRIRVEYMVSDGIKHNISRNRTIALSEDAKQLMLHPVLLNYSIKEPYISYYLEGYDSEPTVISYKDVSEITYANLPSGTYTFHLSVLDEVTKEPLENYIYTIVKERRIFEYRWFKLYFAGICSLFLIWCSWIIIKRRNDRLLAETEGRLALAKKEAALGNEVIMTIAGTVDAKDLRTSKHSERVADYSAKIARALGWTEEECENIRKIGLLHDIGKIGIPDSVLNKPGRLTDEEYDIMKTHVTKGAEILKNFTAIKDVDLGVKYHHERYDGKGYPHGLEGEEIPLCARIIAVADTFDAMTSNRVYRGRLSQEAVIAEIKRVRGSQFDPQVTDVFLKLLDEKIIDMEALYNEE